MCEAGKSIHLLWESSSKAADGECTSALEIKVPNSLQARYVILYYHMLNL